MFRAKPMMAQWPKPLLVAGVLLAPSTLWAEGEWSASVRLDSAHTDNANKSSTAPISERQDEAELSAGAGYENRWLLFSASYEASRRHFNEGSQEDRSLLEGDSELEFGKTEDPLGLTLTHTRRAILNAPDAVELLANNDEREIVSAMPVARWRPTGADALILEGRFSEVMYRFNPERDSSRRGGSLVWLHDLSATDHFSVTAQQVDVEFDANPLADYRYQSATLAYEVTLRRLSYRLQAGYNKSDPDQGEDFASPTYHVEATYGEGFSLWRFSARRFITDNSAGSGNVGDLGGFHPGDADTGDLDQLERTLTELRWNTDALCTRCAVTVSVYHQNDNFRSEIEDRSEHGVRLELDYTLSPRASVNAGWERRDKSFDTGVARADFEEDRVRLGYEYAFPVGLAVDVYARREDRRSQSSAPEYDETLVGVGLTYRF